MAETRLDRRLERTRNALLGAFFDLVETRHYEEIGVADIAERANVSRSTFYEHFSGKDGLLASSIAGPFAVLADTVRAEDNASRLVQLLDHFWDNRALARGIFLGPVRRKVIAVLIGQIEQRLIAAGLGRRGVLIVPTRLAAIQLAEALVAPVTAWLIGESRCTAGTLAAALRRVGVAALTALRASGTGEKA